MSSEFLGDFGDCAVQVVVTVPPLNENCYLVKHKPTDSLVIIDPGGNAPKIIEAIREFGGKPQAIWLTHGHGDHVGAARALEEEFNIETYAHREESSTLSGARVLMQKLGMPEPELPQRLRLFRGEPEMRLGTCPVRVVHTPGHTPGGVVYDFGDFAFTGDTLFNGGVGRTDLPGGDRQILVASLDRLLNEKLTSPDTVLFSGHGNEWVQDMAQIWWSQVRAPIMAG